ncbi:MAG TPA: hypothetical protein VF646_20170, partial [Cytophagales bacterium]
MLLLMLQSQQEDTGRRIAAEPKGQTDSFRKMKPRFKYVNRKRFNTYEFGVNRTPTFKRMDSLAFRKLFRKSRIFTGQGGWSALYYAYNERPGYYQLV